MQIIAKDMMLCVFTWATAQCDSMYMKFTAQYIVIGCAIINICCEGRVRATSASDKTHNQFAPNGQSEMKELTKDLKRKNE